MRGAFSLRNFKISMLLLAAMLAPALVWSYLPHLVFFPFLIVEAFFGLMYAVNHDAFRQARLTLTASPPQWSAPLAPRPAPTVVTAPASDRARRSRAAQARAKKRGEVLLHPDATVTLADERAAADIDDVFTSLNRELVGLLPVKEKVEEIASLLLVDRVRHAHRLAADLELSRSLDDLMRLEDLDILTSPIFSLSGIDL